MSTQNSVETRVAIFDLLGRNVKNLWDGKLKPGENIFMWNGEDNNFQSVASGLYFVVVSARDGLVSRQVTFMK